MTKTLNLRLDSELSDRLDAHVAETDERLESRRYTKTEAVERALAAFLDGDDRGPVESRLDALEARMDAVETSNDVFAPVTGDPRA